MNHYRATELIERYFAGETSLAEEDELKNYFAGSDVAPELADYAPLFAYWQRESEVVAPPRRTKVLRLPRFMLAAAAALALLVMARTLTRDPAPLISHDPVLTEFPVAEPVDWSSYEVTDEREALLILKTTLGTASRQLNRGTAITLRKLKRVDEALN